MTLMDNFKKDQEIIFLVEITAEDLILRFATKDVNVHYFSKNTVISSVSSLTLSGNYGEISNVHVTGNVSITGDYNHLENVEIDGDLTISATAASTQLKGVTIHGIYSNYGSDTQRIDISSDPKHFDGIILNEMAVRNYFDWNSLRYSASSVSLKLANKDRLQDYEVVRKIDNATAKIWVWSESSGWNDLVDRPIFQGVVRKRGYNKYYYEIDILDFSATNNDGLSSLSISSQHMADTILSILLSHTNINIDYIDTASIETMRGILPGIEMVTTVDTWVGSFDLIDRILGQCMCARHQKWGKVSIVSFDINGPALWHINPTHILGETVNIGFTAFEKITNKLNVSYGPAAGAWGSTISIDKTNNKKCKESDLTYGPLPEIDLKLTDCATLANANYCIDRYLDFFAIRHETIELDLPYSVAFDMECGDVGELTIEEGSSNNRETIRASDNLVSNGSFEIGDPPNGWFIAAGDLDRHADPNTGTYCLEINENGGANPTASQTISVIGGYIHHFSFYVKRGTESSWAATLYDNTNGAYLTTGINAGLDESGEATSMWIKHSQSVIIPSNCVEIQVLVAQICANGSGTTILFDDVELYRMEYINGWSKEPCILYEKSYLATHINTKWWRID
jgi:hypothetical protein